MGIFEGLGSDCSVGAIVWVRRRNGSWWPGKVVGINELSASLLTSPRSGTPVKLLGRDDASVDWYNLEKSKRVKSFRCGEFDDCIERAESSQGIPIKKREKYARREDAILHALELEKQHLEKKQQKVGIASTITGNKIPSGVEKELDSLSPSENYFGNKEARDNCRCINHKAGSRSKRLKSSLGNPLYSHKVEQWQQLSGEGDDSQIIPRMRGLQDFGLRISSSKRELSLSVTCESSQDSVLVDNHVYDFSSGRHGLGGANLVDSIKNSLGMKQKLPQVGRHSKCRTLDQVLQSSATLPVCQSLPSDGDALSVSMKGEKELTGVISGGKKKRCFYWPSGTNDWVKRSGVPSDQMPMSRSQSGVDTSFCHGSFMEENTCSGLIETTGSDSSGRDYLDPVMEEDMAVLSDAIEIPIVPESGKHERNIKCGRPLFRVQVQLENNSNEGLDESALSYCTSQHHPREQSTATGISPDTKILKWHPRGRPNIHNLTERPMEVIEVTNKCNKSICKIYDEGEEKNAKADRMENFGYHKEDMIGKDLGGTQPIGFGNKRNIRISESVSKYLVRNNNYITDSDDDSHIMYPSDREADQLSQVALGGCYEESDDHDGNYNTAEPMLVDVDLKVHVSYHGEHVPLVSLTSRLNGKAIIGHPIRIEVMEDGSSDLLSAPNDFFKGPVYHDGNEVIPPVWQTAKRMSMPWVLRPHLSSSMEGGEVDPLQYSDLESKYPYKKIYATHLHRKTRCLRKISAHACRPLSKKFLRKPAKKGSMSNQKTRRLSSIANEQKPGSNNSDTNLTSKNPGFNPIFKPERAPSSVTCVPVKLVYSRILEAICKSSNKTNSGFDDL